VIILAWFSNSVTQDFEQMCSVQWPICHHSKHIILTDDFLVIALIAHPFWDDISGKHKRFVAECQVIAGIIEVIFKIQQGFCSMKNTSIDYLRA